MPYSDYRSPNLRIATNQVPRGQMLSLRRSPQPAAEHREQNLLRRCQWDGGG
jgi:hypothetical protein